MDLQFLIQEYKCNPFEEIKLQAKIQDKAIYVFCTGKWRPVRYWGRSTLPSKKIEKEMEHTIRLCSIFKEKVFQDKKMTFLWL